MKRIFSLIIAVIMVVLMVSACGGNSDVTTDPTVSTDGTSGTSASTTDGKTSGSTEATDQTTTGTIVNPDVSELEVVYLPANSTTEAYAQDGDVYFVTSSEEALSVASGDSAGQIKYFYSTTDSDEDYIHTSAEHNVEIAAGHFYLIDKAKNNAVIKDLGSVFNTLTADRGGLEAGMPGFTFMYAGKELHNYASSLPGWLASQDNFVYTISDMNNQDYSFEVENAPGNFGTMTITDVTDTAIIATVGAETGKDITNLKFRFVYFDYMGNTISEAEAQSTPKDLPTGCLDTIYEIEGMTIDEWYEEFRTVWGNEMYGKTSDVQAAAMNELAQLSPAAYYVRSLNNYNSVVAKEGVTDEEITAAELQLETATELLEDFDVDYGRAYDDIFWSSDVANSALARYKAAQTEAGVTEIKYPTFTYYYDNATDTYTVFSTSFEVK